MSNGEGPSDPIFEAKKALMNAESEEERLETSEAYLEAVAEHGDDSDRNEAVDDITKYGPDEWDSSRVERRAKDVKKQVQAGQVDVRKVVQEVTDSRERSYRYTFHVAVPGAADLHTFTLTTEELTTQRPFTNRLLDVTRQFGRAQVVEYDDWNAVKERYLTEPEQVTIHEPPIDTEHDVAAAILEKLQIMDITADLDEFKAARQNCLYYDRGDDTLHISSRTIQEAAESAVRKDVNLRAVRDVLDGILVPNDPANGQQTTRTVRFLQERHNAWRFRLEQLKKVPGLDLPPLPDDDDDDDGGAGAAVDDGGGDGGDSPPADQDASSDGERDEEGAEEEEDPTRPSVDAGDAPDELACAADGCDGTATPVATAGLPPGEKGELGDPDASRTIYACDTCNENAAVVVSDGDPRPPDWSFSSDPSASTSTATDGGENDDPDVMTDGGVDIQPVPPDRALKGLPGTGKTTALLDILETELESGTPVGRVAVSTFRRLMANEFATRAADVVGGELPDDHLMRTTHAICYRLLGLVPEDVVTDQDRERVCERLTPTVAFDAVGTGTFTGPPADEDEWFEVTSVGQEVGNDLFYIYSFCRNTLRDPRRDWRGVTMRGETRDRIAASSAKLVPAFIDEYEAYKRENSLLDFDDMLSRVVHLGIVPDVDLLLEDEFQDKTPLQLRVYNTWAPHIPRVVVAGDPFQAIYTFLGTDPEFFETAYQGADESRLLETSYRFGPDLWRTATSILEGAGYDVPTITPAGETDLKRLSWADYQDVVQLFPEEDAFHLGRANFHGGGASSTLHRAGIPFWSKFGASWTDRQIDLYNGVVKTQRAFDEADAFEDPRFSLPEREAYRLVEALPAAAVAGTKKAHLNELGSESADAVDGRPLLELADAAPLLDASAPFANLLDSALSSTVRRRMQQALVARDGRPIGTVAHEVETIHGSKGREKDHVFLLASTTDRIAEQADPTTEARVFFVAATRARKHLWVVDPPPKYQPAYDLPVVSEEAPPPAAGD